MRDARASAAPVAYAPASASTSAVERMHSARRWADARRGGRLRRVGRSRARSRALAQGRARGVRDARGGGGRRRVSRGVARVAGRQGRRRVRLARRRGEETRVGRARRARLRERDGGPREAHASGGVQPVRGRARPEAGPAQAPAVDAGGAGQVAARHDDGGPGERAVAAELGGRGERRTGRPTTLWTGRSRGRPRARRGAARVPGSSRGGGAASAGDWTTRRVRRATAAYYARRARKSRGGGAGARRRRRSAVTARGGDSEDVDGRYHREPTDGYHREPADDGIIASRPTGTVSRPGGGPLPAAAGGGVILGGGRGGGGGGGGGGGFAARRTTGWTTGTAMDASASRVRRRTRVRRVRRALASRERRRGFDPTNNARRKNASRDDRFLVRPRPRGHRALAVAIRGGRDHFPLVRGARACVLKRGVTDAQAQAVLDYACDPARAGPRPRLFLRGDQEGRRRVHPQHQAGPRVLGGVSFFPGAPSRARRVPAAGLPLLGRRHAGCFPGELLPHRRRRSAAPTARSTRSSRGRR